MHKTIFFGPMANNLTERVKSVLGKEELSHREKEFSDILSAVRNKIKKVINADEEYTAIMLTGSGTAAVEAMVSNAIPPDKCLLVLNNGLYCQRIIDIARTYRIKTKAVDFGFAHYFNLEATEKAMADPEVSYVAMVHHETSSGILNPLRKVGTLCKRYHKTFLVDAISSIVSEDIDVTKDNIDFLAGSSNKGIQGAEGVSFVIAKLTKIKEMKSRQKQNLYLDLYANYEFQERGQTPFTPAVRIFVALNEALDELFEEGMDNRRRRYRTLADKIRESLLEMDLVLPIVPKHRSNTVTLVLLPNRVKYPKLHDELKKKGFVIYSGNKIQQDETFRLCNVGDIQLSDVERFLAVFKKIIKEDMYGNK